MDLNHRLQHVALGLCLVSAVALPLVWAQSNEPGPPKPLITIPLTEPAKPLEETQPATVLPPEKPIPKLKHCNVTNQLDLTRTQRAKLKTAKNNFVADNQAAFDSLRIKRELIKKLGNEPKNKRQSDQLKSEIQQELEALRQKKEASLQAILTPAQFNKMQAIRQQCLAAGSTKQPKQPTKTRLKNSNDKQAERQMNKTIKNIPKKPL
jgi:Spy/CpxP family protein refolding chaperone